MRKNITLRQEISSITKRHLKKYKSFVFGQNLLGVGQVNGTLPKELKEKNGIIDLPMADVAGGGIVAGAALSMKRPMYIIRYQGYNWFNMTFIINYACKSFAIWKIPAPIFIRGVSNEGCVGPVAGSAQLSLFYKMPGIKIFSPFTPHEYRKIYQEFVNDNSVYYVSEHRKSYNNSFATKNVLKKKSDITVILNSITRKSAIEINSYFHKSKYKVSIIHLYKLKPFNLSNSEKKTINQTKKLILICDNDYEDGLPAIIKSKVCDLTECPNIKILGLPYKTAGHHPKNDVIPPNAKKIITGIEKFLEKKLNLGK
jgi:pyruvate/2-oxoglutarate/acetoin dehydrogenase E1 component